jgi:hypothetical protein
MYSKDFLEKIENFRHSTKKDSWALLTPNQT